MKGSEDLCQGAIFHRNRTKMDMIAHETVGPKGNISCCTTAAIADTEDNPHRVRRLSDGSCHAV